MFFVDVLGYCMMGNHIHLALRVHPESGVDDNEVRESLALSSFLPLLVAARQPCLLTAYWGASARASLSGKYSASFSNLASRQPRRKIEETSPEHAQKPFHEKASQRPPWRTTFFCLRALASSPDKSCFHSHSLWAFAIKPGALWNPHIGSCHLEHGLYFVAGKQLDLGAERSLPDGTFQLWALLMVNVGD